MFVHSVGEVCGEHRCSAVDAVVLCVYLMHAQSLSAFEVNFTNIIQAT